MKNTLIHVCCAPCSIMCVETLRQKGIEPTAFWYNNNIHPFTEYRERREAMKAYAASIDLPLIVEDEYGLRGFVQAVADNIAARCVFCYRSRLERTAREAAARGFDSFTVVLDSDGKQQLIYKHAISTIAPVRPVELTEDPS